MQKPLRTYRALLIRFWWAENAGHPVWRVEVEEPGSEAKLHFEEVGVLCEFLIKQFAESREAGHAQPESSN